MPSSLFRRKEIAWRFLPFSLVSFFLSITDTRGCRISSAAGTGRSRSLAASERKQPSQRLKSEELSLFFLHFCPPLFSLSFFPPTLSLPPFSTSSLSPSLSLYQARLASPAAALLAAAFLAFSALPAAEHAWTNSSKDLTYGSRAVPAHFGAAAAAAAEEEEEGC